ncbi:PIG-L deacetylase family protein [Stenotrophomonas sp. 278]|uniref:PIG-L deacetylase family protein n=1 Tax=Stenotrophomonas sp. 278 TaxID=2479851 RepID=UPI000F684583|nr:PIG-L deacetylase family protein [Stenotrophomonas sp. 278]RRU11966.1 PIG-L family deacetylase [Stenotrophomonas sp. 278]
MTTPHRVLAVGAHPDDIELGCGGSLAKLAAAGAAVHAVILSRGRFGACEDVDRAQESALALRTLGVQSWVQLDFPDTRLQEVARDMVHHLEQTTTALQPDRVYTMSAHDRHQDHRAVHDASIIAFRRVRQVLCYETPSSLPRFTPDLHEDISGQFELKLQALRAHESQRHRDYMSEAHLRCLAQFRGQQVGLDLCEGFVPYRMVL